MTTILAAIAGAVLGLLVGLLIARWRAQAWLRDGSVIITRQNGVRRIVTEEDEL